MEFKNRAEYSQWRKSQMTLPLDELIAKPNCDMDCPEGRQFSCDCDKCVIYTGLFREGEMDRRFLPIEIKQIMESWNPDTGWYEEGKGCVLPRSLRPEVCLRMMCNKYEKTAGG